jgi:hypothetical protein
VPCVSSWQELRWSDFSPGQLELANMGDSFCCLQCVQILKKPLGSLLIKASPSWKLMFTLRERKARNKNKCLWILCFFKAHHF